MGPEMVAFGRVETDQQLEIKRMYVRPGFRGLAVGRMLLQRLRDDARDELQ